MSTEMLVLPEVACLQPTEAGVEASPRVLLLSTSLLMDRVFLYTGLLDCLSKASSTAIWASSAAMPRFRELWERTSRAKAEGFPSVHPFREFPYNILRRLNEFTWDFCQRPPSRISMWKHVRRDRAALLIRALRLPAKVLATVRAEQLFENWLEKLLLSYPRSPEAVERFASRRPDVVVTTGPYQFEQPAIVAAAKGLGIRTMAVIPSWDNVSTKDRMMFKYDAFIVWSEQTKADLHRFYPYTRKTPVYVVGAPQFDIFFQEGFRVSRQAFCGAYGLRPELPLIVYAVGSPNFLKEHHGALDMARRVARGDLGDVQLIVRPHPLHDRGEMNALFAEFQPRVVLQQTGAEPGVRSQDENQISEWVNTFYHADVVVNLSSTVAIDAAIFDRPVVNLDYDPEPGRPNQALVKDVNHRWTHFKPIAESGGVWLVDSPEETIEAVRTYLAQPELHREKRRSIAEHVCQYLDGRCSERMADAILDFARNHSGDRTEYGN